jgi:hypothetical protein
MNGDGETTTTATIAGRRWRRGMAKVTVEDAFYLIDKYYNEAIIHCPYVLKKVTYALKKATEEIERREEMQDDKV